ncbi:hypothetical protein P60_gp02 [Synechococcus phage P60]|uniref:Uncharacterized protein n=1 Tax=Synechococcus phage P60 TaxID=2905923 RepID=L0CQD6_9CAUD|nr:hypothetical protein P60_gp02 [Synechococcus phage P60]AGA17872.1 hypothetical protein P60_gp02 [Synechococcus phage P60]
MNIYLPDVAYAKQELARLHGIRASLARNIVACRTDYVSVKSAETWVKIYQARLKENVLPAIKKCESYIRLHSN